MTRATDLAAKVRALPHRPGVYLMRDRLGRVIYVGKANSLRRRVGQYFQRSRRSKDPKTIALIDAITDFETFIVNSEAEAILLEGKLIKEYRPRYNALFKDDKRFLLVKLDMSEEYPRFKFARLKKDDGARYFGPFAHAGAVRRAMQYLRKEFGVLVSGTGKPTAKDMKYSSYLVPVPLAEMPREEYLARVEQACEFLQGRNREGLEHLEELMQQAASEQQYERAATLRDVLVSLREIARAARERKFARDLSSPIDTQEEIRALQEILGLPHLPRHIEGFDISNISGTLSVASAVCFQDGKPHKAHYRHYRIVSVVGTDDFASIAEVVGRRYTRALEEQMPLPDLVMVDGGQGQLAAARAELNRLGLSHLPAIGLAKRFEEIHMVDQPAPLRLDRSAPALHLVQRLRDEAHRFANAYHQKLRKKRIKESILDEFQGLGDKRKTALLRQFGSIERLRQATVEDLSNVDGIGQKTAVKLLKFLKSQDS